MPVLSTPGRLRSLAALCGVAWLSGCNEGAPARSTAPTTAPKPSLSYTLQPPTIIDIAQATLTEERLIICKVFAGAGPGFVYASATFQVHAVDGGNPSNVSDATVTLQDGKCADFGALFGGRGADFTITEVAPATGYTTTWATFIRKVGGPVVPNTSGSGTVATGSSFGSRPGQTAIGTRVDFINTLIPTGRIGDFVWEDRNANGVQDAGEPGIGGVTATLTKNGVTVGTTTTDAMGKYLFSDLSGGTYQVGVAAPAGYTRTATGQGGDPANDSNVDPATVTIADGATDLTVDFGFYRPAALGDRVWDDANANGLQDAGEQGIVGATVTLTGSAGTTTATTGANGSYGFSNLAPGTYTVSVATPAGYVASPAAQGADRSIDSDGGPATVTLASGDNDTTIDFGFYVPRTGRIGDFVWYDLDGDGVQESGEPGIGGVKVTLSLNGAVVATDTTDKYGKYLFSNLAPGTYAVTAATPTFLAPTASLAGSDRTIDSNGSPATVTLAPGGVDLTIDFGFAKAGYGGGSNGGKIGDLVWNDANGNGRQDQNENGIGGVTVTLRRNGTTIATDVTDRYGAYLFSNLAAGTYTVSVATPNGYTPTTANASNATPSTDSDPNPATVTLAAGQTDRTIDFGFVKQRSGGGQGCAAGYWYDSKHHDKWKGFGPSDKVDDILGTKVVLPNAKGYDGTALSALTLSGSPQNDLIRQAITALLNANDDSGINYKFGTTFVRAMLRVAIAAGDHRSLEALLKWENEFCKCPLD